MSIDRLIWCRTPANLIVIVVDVVHFRFDFDDLHWLRGSRLNLVIVLVLVHNDGRTVYDDDMVFSAVATAMLIMMSTIRQHGRRTQERGCHDCSHK